MRSCSEKDWTLDHIIDSADGRRLDDGAAWSFARGDDGVAGLFARGGGLDGFFEPAGGIPDALRGESTEEGSRFLVFLGGMIDGYLLTNKDHKK